MCLCSGTGSYRVSRWNAVDRIYEKAEKECDCVAKTRANSGKIAGAIPRQARPENHPLTTLAVGGEHG